MEAGRVDKAPLALQQLSACRSQPLRVTRWPPWHHAGMKSFTTTTTAGHGPLWSDLGKNQPRAQYLSSDAERSTWMQHCGAPLNAGRRAMVQLGPACSFASQWRTLQR